ncbi:hypothetical protein GEMRC1_004414 [Eukaryota sp. GEM-RC1]
MESLRVYSLYLSSKHLFIIISSNFVESFQEPLLQLHSSPISGNASLITSTSLPNHFSSFSLCQLSFDHFLLGGIISNKLVLFSLCTPITNHSFDPFLVSNAPPRTSLSVLSSFDGGTAIVASINVVFLYKVNQSAFFTSPTASFKVNGRIQQLAINPNPKLSHIISILYTKKDQSYLILFDLARISRVLKAPLSPINFITLNPFKTTLFAACQGSNLQVWSFRQLQQPLFKTSLGTSITSAAWLKNEVALVVGTEEGDVVVVEFDKSSRGWWSLLILN